MKAMEMQWASAPYIFIAKLVLRGQDSAKLIVSEPVPSGV
ncbi:hypothetical protein GGD46_000672 [Rhizobium lusitanum]|uniref:Uncharacterized protein n=1 Tax=Rhizobium lusitanum TaxID=293958 RepID=A0A7X0MAF5_9HYPH|nr:hypothetical protein [Rhizobium lusitanum]